MNSIFAKTPPGRPDLRQRLHIELATHGVGSRVTVKPGSDDWFGETDISRFITSAEVEARAGEVTKAYLDCVMVEVVTEAGVQLASVFTPPCDSRLRRLWPALRLRTTWRFQLTRGTA